MSNPIVTKGFSLDFQLLITKGYGKVTIVVKKKGGYSPSPARFVKFNLKRNIVGIKQFSLKKDYNLFGIIKKNVERIYAILGTKQYNILKNHNLSGIKEFIINRDLAIEGVVKNIFYRNHEIRGIRKYNQELALNVFGIRKYNIEKTLNLKGTLKREFKDNRIVTAKRNITNILMALGLLDNQD